VEDARRASAEANARLRAIEDRLAKLDVEVAAIRAAAEADFAAEEQRIQHAAEVDARRVIEGAESEIATAAKSARRELKIYAAELAVDLAAKQIKVDAATDAALLRSFVSELGKDGK
jgi:F-type H+-transporting ATPase subunit b